ncbi:penicillin-binding protein 2 [Plectonema cf. radiosum LEGE 06105]|uniref:Penicillin-binding protein 2 n=1 Tax=Plectonema cf. radiosum LEGE 06105 TaxID=945769 RepID=A0A8J7FII7_9CYAN|nr:penicillin-binding protein 2 [Plectonema radiosum]MBE9214361.1 penicillin-binding protein 2 [Plectonema cf. radiosum LEGE 06105]
MQKFPGKTSRNLKREHIHSRFNRSILKDKQRKFATTPTRVSPNPRNRLFMVWGVLIAACLGLGINLYRLQIVDGAKLTQKARNQQMFSMRPFIPRRQILDRNNRVLGLDLPVYTLYVHPEMFDKNQSPSDIARQLGTILNQDPEELEAKFNKQKSGIFISSKLAEEVADQIAGLKLNGIDLTKKYSRYYPYQDLVSDVVGYVNSDRRGKAGIEYSQEKFLERSMKTVRMSKDGNGRLIANRAPDGFLNVDKLQMQLTIDVRLQRATREALKQQIEKYQAKRGAVIVMDSWDGSILALACQPTYNPNNNFTQDDISLFKNWAVADLYEPGSTFKPLNVAIALETGSIQPNDVFRDTGLIKVADREIRNAEKNSNGNISVAQILQTSSNIGMVKIIQRLQPSIYYGWLERIGLGQKSDVDLPSETNSRLKPQEEFTNSPIEPATASFGQGFSLTALQLVQMHGALANGGKLVTPHVVKGLIDNKGQMHTQPNLSAPRQVFSPQTTQTVLEMMESVVDEGSGKPAEIPGYRIAGKTGTAEKAGATGGYIRGSKITSFVSILPVESPRYVVLALVDEPKGENTYGSTVAAPIAKEVMEALISIEKIPPTSSR